MSFLRSVTWRKPSSSSKPTSPVRSQPSLVSTSAVASGSLKYPWKTVSLRRRISPSSAILISKPGSGGPTDPNR
jgi:hypothetical protein